MSFKLNNKKFKSLSEIFQIVQINHIKIFLVRYDFSKTDYFNKNIKLKFELSFVQTFIQWAILSVLLCVFFKIFPSFDAFIVVWGKAIRVQHYDVFISTPIIGFIAIEKIFYKSFGQLLRYKNGMIDTVFELADNIEGEVSRIEKLSYLDFYSKSNYYSTLGYKLSSFCLIPLVLQLSYLSVVEYLKASITARQLVLYIWMFILMNLNAANSLSAIYVILPDFIFILKIFRSKFIKCQIFLKYTNASLNVSFLNKFITEYIHLHRRISNYNCTLSGQLQVEDLVFKLSGIIVWIFYIKQDEPLNHVSYIILFLYTATYCIFQLVLSRLGYFPEQNGKSYQYLNSLNARSQKVDVFQRKRSVNYFYTFNPNEKLRKLIKVNCFVDFMASNKLGFTYGNQFLITKKEVFTNLFHDFYFLTLFYKRLSV